MITICARLLCRSAPKIGISILLAGSSWFSVLQGRVQVAPGDYKRRPRRSLQVRGSPRLQNGSLRALEEALNYFLLEVFSCQVWFSVLLGRVQVARRGDELRPRRSLEVRGRPRLQNSSLRALEEAWNDFLLEAFSCQVWSFSVLLGRVVAPGGHELRPRSASMSGEGQSSRMVA